MVFFIPVIVLIVLGVRPVRQLYILLLLFIIIIIIIIKTTGTGLIGENKVVYKLLSQPHKQMSHGKLEKTQLSEATNG